MDNPIITYPPETRENLFKQLIRTSPSLEKHTIFLELLKFFRSKKIVSTIY